LVDLSSKMFFKTHVPLAGSRDPYYVYKLNDRRGNPDKLSFVCKTSKFKAKFAAIVTWTELKTMS